MRYMKCNRRENLFVLYSVYTLMSQKTFFHALGMDSNSRKSHELRSLELAAQDSFSSTRGNQCTGSLVCHKTSSWQTAWIDEKVAASECNGCVPHPRLTLSPNGLENNKATPKNTRLYSSTRTSPNHVICLTRNMLFQWFLRSPNAAKNTMQMDNKLQVQSTPTKN